MKEFFSLLFWAVMLFGGVYLMAFGVQHLTDWSWWPCFWIVLATNVSFAALSEAIKRAAR